MTRKRHPRHDPMHRYGLIGVLVMLVLAVAIFYSYRAGDGLPWQSHYEIHADVPDATRVVHHDDVRIGGVRVGQVKSVTAIPAPRTGKPFARLVLSLDKSVAPLPSDTRLQIRSASLLGRSYVELELGHSSRTISSGGGLERGDVVPAVQVQDLLDMFDRSTAQATRNVIGGLGDGFAGRGGNFNAALASFSHLLGPTRQVMGAIASPDARLSRYLGGWEATVHAVAPVAGNLASGFANAGTTFGAMHASGPALGGTIEAFPSAESATTRALARLDPALIRLARASREMLPGARQLPSTLPAVNGMLDAGARALRGTPAFAGQLRTTLATLDRLSRYPAMDGAVRKFIDLADTADLALHALTPAQVQCNVFGLYTRNNNNAQLAFGTQWSGFTLLGLDAQGAENEAFQHGTPSRNMHIDPAPHENYQECESGNEPFDGNSKLMGNPPGLQSNKVPHTRPPADALAHTPPGTP